jgi:hypothetical protein
MKTFKILPLLSSLFISLAIIPSTAWSAGDFDEESLEIEQITPPPKPDATPDKPTPFSLSSSVDVIGKSKITKGFFKGDELLFAQAQVEAGMVFYYNPVYTEGANVALTYAVNRIQWEQNLFTNQELFHTVSLSVGFFTKRMDNWLWRAQLAANFDSPGKRFTGEYISYDGLVWGRYDYCENIGIHVGFIAQTGMRLDKAWPILGFDWQINKKMKLSLVYPTNISFNYALNKHWSMGVAARFFNVRHRIKRDEVGARDLIRYENTGAEFAIMYEATGVEYNIHAGYTLGGKYRISNPSNHHPRNIHLGCAGYVGAEVDVKF